MTVLRTERDGAVATIWIENPPFNFLTNQLMAELGDAIASLEADSEVRAVILTSAIEGLFVSHFNVAEILAGVEFAPMQLNDRTASMALRASQAADRIPGGRTLMAKAGASGVGDLRDFHATCRRIRASSMVFIAAINGRAMGGGCELALSCDIRIMADGPYQIGQPEILLGISPGGGGTQMLARVLGVGRALELCLEGAPITPQEALAIGLVTRLVAPEDLMDQAQNTAARLARRSPTAVAAIKRAIHEGGSLPLEKGLHIERAAFLAACSTPSAKLAMASYSADVATVGVGVAERENFFTNTLSPWLDGTRMEFSE